MTFEDLLTGKVKLEFGNKEQIQVIDMHQAWEKEKEEGSGTYRVSYAVSGTAYVDVYAENEDEARELADDERDMDSVEDIDWDFLECEEVSAFRGEP